MKIICVGKNYQEHINEMNEGAPVEPVVFIKPDTAVLLDKNPFVIPAFSNQIEHEVEVVVKICKVGKHIGERFAANYYEQIGVGIDFTARDVQKALKAKGLPWEKAKAFDGSAVIGGFVEKSTFEDLNNLQFSLLRNGEVVQQGNTKDMICKIDQIITYVSQYFTLKTGDLIFTGTPAGVGVVERGDVLQGLLEGQTLLNVKIR